MPDTDENRAYYEMKFEFLDDLSITNVKNDFYFYRISSNTGSPYLQMGWLDENNQSQIASYGDMANGTAYTLTYTAKPETHDTYKAALTHAVTSFKFDN